MSTSNPRSRKRNPDEENLKQCSEKKRNWTDSTRFADMSDDLIESVLTRLPPVDFLRAKSVCSSWNSIIEEHFAVVLKKRSYQASVPWLVLPQNPQGKGQCGNFTDFFNPEEIRVYDLGTASEKLNACSCLGSSHGWLVFLNPKLELFVINPFTKSEIEFPAIDKSLGMVYPGTIEGVNDRFLEYLSLFEHYLNLLHHRYTYVTGQEIQKHKIAKAILTSDPSRANGNFGVAMIYDFRENIGFCGGKNGKWINLTGDHREYWDIMCLNNHLFALSNDGLLESWDLSGCPPKKKTETRVCFPEKALEDLGSNTFFLRMYLVESCGEILIVARFISIPGKNACPLGCPKFETPPSYKTSAIRVYKFENLEKWVRVESLGDFSVFIGGNHSVSVPIRYGTGSCLKPNSVYFMDDDWNKSEAFLEGGHDIGVFSLQDQKVTFCGFGPVSAILQGAFWISPNLI